MERKHRPDLAQWDRLMRGCYLGSLPDEEPLKKENNVWYRTLETMIDMISLFLLGRPNARTAREMDAAL